ncbi:MAG: transposase [Deltaproteobacteria bacterium]|nr:transposase [Deltaproteobacteria bacterium]
MSEPKVSDLHFWDRGYCVSTVGLDEATIRKYIREQDEIERTDWNWNLMMNS